MPSYNALSIKILSSGLTPVVDVDSSIARAEKIVFDAFYPGGVYGIATFFCPRDVTRAWMVKARQLVAIYNGLQLVWFGRISAIHQSLEAASSGSAITAVGLWGATLGKRSWSKRWADNRVDESAWVYPSVKVDVYTRNNKCDLLRGSNRLTFVPHNIRWNADQNAYAVYTM